MLDRQIKMLLEEQIKHEFYSSYLYLGFENFFSCKGFEGFSNWYSVQKKEELDHGMLFIKYLRGEDEKIYLHEIDKPELPNFREEDSSNCSDCMAILKMGLEHEKLVTAKINNIYKMAMEKNDFRTLNFLEWFIEEQREEEENANALIGKMKLFGGSRESLYLLDKELAERKYQKPSLKG